MTVPTPAQVLEQRRELLLKQDVDGFVDLFAPDGVIELPFAGPGMPSRLAGQQAISDYSHRMDASPLRIDDLEATALYHTDDPEVVIIELATRGTVTSTGRTFEGTSIQVFRIRGGKIVLFRDYFNVPGLQDLLAV
jgi:ketosteroid isomerase-like protein